MIGLGYAPGTVYRLQREFRKAQAGENAVSMEAEQVSPVLGAEDQGAALEILQSEGSHNQEQIAVLRAEVDKLADAQAAIGELIKAHDRLSDQMQQFDGKVRQQLQQQREHHLICHGRWQDGCCEDP